MIWRRKNRLHAVEFDETIRKLGVYAEIALQEVSVLIDIGVSDGRFVLSSRNLFPRLSRVVGIDPIDEYPRTTEFEYVKGVIGTKCQSIDFSISEDLFTSSKLYQGVRSSEVNQYRMECLLERLGVKSNQCIFVKIDTQGTDIECLSSFGKYLGSISMAILEVQMKPFASGMKYFSESVNEISKLGFEVCDFSNPVNRSFDSTLGQIDLFIAPKGSELVKNIKW